MKSIIKVPFSKYKIEAEPGSDDEAEKPADEKPIEEKLETLEVV